MNSWNPFVAHSTFTTQSVGFLSHILKDRVNLNPPAVANAIRDLVKTENVDPNSPSTLKKALAITSSNLTPKRSYSEPLFGYTAMWTSEVGDSRTLNGLLNHADTFLDPTWECGGLYYPRNEEVSDEDGNWTMMEAFTGNGGIGYARLNVLDGQRKMWERPWTKEEVEGTPWVDGVGLESGVDLLRGVWDEEKSMMAMSVRSWDGDRKLCVLLEFIWGIEGVLT
jgi:hypothetical protein